MKKIFVIVAIIFFLPLTAQAIELSKDNLGLNVHWALGGNFYDYDYELKLEESGAKWAREHFSAEVLMGESADDWWDRYDTIMANYQELGLSVVGMLAYGPDNGVYTRPDLDWWSEYVTAVVDRYHDQISVWEIWNEPDSSDYLENNTVANYKELLRVGYQAVKAIDPNALVLNGALAQPDTDYALELYQEAGDYFDALNIHLYYCDRFISQGSIASLQTAVTNLHEATKQYNEQAKIWITEFGCSTYNDSVTENLQTQYLSQASRWLSGQPYIEKIFIYTFRNPTTRGDYENNFGLVDSNFTEKNSWRWFEDLPSEPIGETSLIYGAYRDLTWETNRATALRTGLEEYFGAGLIPISDTNWSTVVNAYAYGGYSVQAICQAIRYGGYTVSPTIHSEDWQTHQSYIDYIDKDWTGEKIVFAYDQPRIFIADEQEQARELKAELEANYDMSNLRINATNWNTIVNSYVYGQYPVAAIARAIVFGGKTVHPEFPWASWKATQDYLDYIDKELP